MQQITVSKLTLVEVEQQDAARPQAQIVSDTVIFKHFKHTFESIE